MRRSVSEAIKAAPLIDRDKAVSALAMEYAKQIDDGGDLLKFGPLLLNALEALRMSPRARVIARKGTNDDKPAAPAASSRLDELRERRERKSRAASVDSPTTGADA